MSDFVIENGVLLKYIGDGETAVIPEGVEKIQGGAFTVPGKAFGINLRLRRVFLPSGMTEIADSAFKGCVALREVYIPDGVGEIGAWAFGRCRKLASVTIPGSVTKIGVNAFAEGAPLTIHTSAGSYAEKYARENGIKFDCAL